MADLTAQVLAAGAKRHRVAVRLMERALDKRVPVDTGALRFNRRAVVVSGPVCRGTISYTLPYAGITDRGPTAHVIRARSAKALAFKGRAGVTIYRRKVYWRPGPGVAANKGWFTKTLSAFRWRIALLQAGTVR